MVKLFRNAICVKKSLVHGYGVFAEKDIKKGDVVEECYFLVGPSTDYKLNDYYFIGPNEESILPTGYGVIYNHSPEPNLIYQLNYPAKTIVFKAIKDIKSKEELYITYGDKWFSERRLPVKKVFAGASLVPAYNSVLGKIIVFSSGLIIFFEGLRYFLVHL